MIKVMKPRWCWAVQLVLVLQQTETTVRSSRYLHQQTIAVCGLWSRPDQWQNVYCLELKDSPLPTKETFQQKWRGRVLLQHFSWAVRCKVQVTCHLINIPIQGDIRRSGHHRCHLCLCLCLSPCDGGFFAVVSHLCLQFVGHENVS